MERTKKELAIGKKQDLFDHPIVHSVDLAVVDGAVVATVLRKYRRSFLPSLSVPVVGRISEVIQYLWSLFATLDRDHKESVRCYP